MSSPSSRATPCERPELSSLTKTEPTLCAGFGSQSKCTRAGIKIVHALLLFVIVCVASYGHAELISGRVVHVADGDTLTVLDTDHVQHKVRLAGIDAQEKSQAYGQRARDSLAELVANWVVIVQTDKRDRYGRRVGKVLVTGSDINIEQIRRGMAWFYRDYAGELTPADQQSYYRAETEAKDFRRGLWAESRPVPPWEFRKTGRSQ